MVSGRSILLTVRVIYLPGKAAIFYPGGLDNALRFLFADLTSLSLPHPEESNVRILSTGVLELYWETTEGSTLHQTLVRKVASTSKDWLQSLTGQLIHKMTYKQEVDKTMKDVSSTQLDSDNCKRVNVKRKGRGRPRKSSLSTSNCRTATSENTLSVTSAKVAESSLTSIPTTIDATLSCEPLSSVSVSPSDLTSMDNATTDQNLTKGIVKIELLDPLLSHDLANLRPPSPHTNLSTQDTLASTEEMTPSHTQKRISRLDFVATPPPAKRVHREQEVAQWIQELEHLNQEVACLAARQAEIRQKLKSAGAMDIPELDSPVDAFACRTRLRALQVEIEAERQKRHEYELVLEDIRRECKAPFIVPSLLDAFIEVAKLTNAAVKL